MAKRYKNLKVKEPQETQVKPGINLKKIAVYTLVALLSISLIGSTIISFFSTGVSY